MANEGDLGNQAADEYLQSALDNAQTATGNEHLTGRCMMCGKESRGAFCSKEGRAKYNAMVRMNQ